MTCSFNNVNCMCQFCEKQCNNGFNCYECNYVRAGMPKKPKGE